MEGIYLRKGSGFYLMKRKPVLFMKGVFYLRKVDFYLTELGFTS